MEEKMRKHTRQWSGARHISSEGGFTLVELLVTIIVLGIVIGSLGALYYLMQITEVRSQRFDTAVRAARTEIEQLRNNGYSSLATGTTSFTADLPSTLPSDRSGIVTVSEPASGLKRVDVTITYSDYGKSQNITLSSDIGIIGIGQGQ